MMHGDSELRPAISLSISLITYALNFILKVQPTLNCAPVVEVTSSTYFILSWRRWQASTDLGNGPVEGYTVYMKAAGSDTWESSGSLMVLTSETRDYFYHVAYNLQSGTNYSFSVAVISSSGREGQRGPETHAQTVEGIGIDRIP